MTMNPSPLPRRIKRPTHARCPLCRHKVPVYPAGTRDEYTAHTTAGEPLVGSEGSECPAAGWLVEDDEVVR